MAGLTKKGKSYYALFKLCKKTKWVRIGAVGYKVALQKLRKLESDFDSTYAGKNLKPITFTDFAKEFLAYREANFAKRTWERDKTSIKALSTYFNKLYLIEIDQKHIELYKAKRIKQVKTRCLNIELHCLSNMLKLALSWNYLRKLPVIKG